jgi:signal transduction histidine kinase
MMPLGPDPSNPKGSAARTLYDIAQGFDSPLDSELRLQHTLRLLRRVVPYDRCALLEVPAAGPARFLVEPDAPEEREPLRRVLTRFLTILSDEIERDVGGRPSNVAPFAHLDSPAHLAVPVVGLDRVLGVLFVRYGGGGAYTDDHLRLLSVIASQIAAYLTACHLREQEAQIVSEHEAARAAADAESRVKDEFLAMLIHELRNPLMAIRSAVQTIAGKAERDPTVRLETGVVERQVNQLVRLLDDLLDVSHLSGGKIELRKETVTLQAIVAEALATTRGFSDARRHGVSVSLPEEPIWLEADAARITQVVATLLNNAAKSTSGGGEISVTGRGERDDVVLRVRDTGIGIVPAMLPRVFDLFAQVNRSGSERGLGVGLTLARALVELHGGTIIVQSEGPGRGCEFTVHLPVGIPAGREGPEANRRVAVQARRILLVEPDDDVREALRRILVLDGHRVEVARDGSRGVELALAAVPEVAFIDIGLPGVDGYEVGRRIRAALGVRVLLVAVTAYAQEQDRGRLSEAGFDAHVVRPVGYETLTRLLGRVVSSDA